MAACKRKDGNAPDKLAENRLFVSKEVVFDNPLRVFTRDGEITNQGVINSFYYRFPSHFPANEYPYIDTLKTEDAETVLLDIAHLFKTSFTASIVDQVLTLTKKDPIITANASFRTSMLQDLLNQSLERNSSFALDTLNGDTIGKQLPQIKGTYKDDKITLPFSNVFYYYEDDGGQPTFFTEYAFLKSSPAPQILYPKDTIAILQGRVIYH
jgi:hypothetical protein